MTTADLVGKYQLIYAAVNSRDIGYIANTEVAVRFNLVQLKVGWSANTSPFSYGRSQPPSAKLWFKTPRIMTLKEAQHVIVIHLL